MADYAEQTGQAVETTGGKPVIELFIKASSISKEDKGACPISQQWFMAFYILAEKKVINLFVTSVNPDNAPDGYVEMQVGRRLPVARVISGTKPDGEAFSEPIFGTNDEIEHLMDVWKCPSLALPKDSKDEGLAERSFYDLYKSLNLLLKTANQAPLVNNLRKINSFLGERRCRYLLADEITYADCQLMPKLHHAKLAAEFYCDFAIPAELSNLREYYDAMYQCEAFKTSCPDDRDLYQFYYEKVPRELQARMKLMPTLMPEGCALLEAAAAAAEQPVQEFQASMEQEEAEEVANGADD